MDWVEIKISVNTSDVDLAGAIANMSVPYGIYIEDYSALEQDALEVAHIDLIDEELLAKDRDTGIIHIYISPEENPSEAVNFLEERYNSEGICYKIEQVHCNDEDWENNWKAYFKPMKIGEKLLVRPIWVDDYESEGRAVLNIEPGVAFGTGTHETTRLCLEALERTIRKDLTVLDVGCGSGILSCAAMLLGAKSVTGVDIDKLAVKIARANGELNKFSLPEYTMLHGNLTDKITKKYDLVLANIVADAIISLSGNIRQFMMPGAKYIVSGIIDLREEEVITALSNYGFSVLERFEEKGWLCFVCE